MTFSDVIKQNGHASVGTLYRKVLDKIVFSYDSIYNSKKAKVRNVVYNAIQISLFVSDLKFSVCFPCWNVFCVITVSVYTTSYLYNLVVPSVENYGQH